MENEKKEKGIFQNILDIAEEIGNESEAQEQLYGNIKQKARYFQENAGGLYQQVQYWTDAQKVQEDNEKIEELIALNEWELKKFKRRRIIIAVITIVILFFL